MASRFVFSLAAALCGLFSSPVAALAQEQKFVVQTSEVRRLTVVDRVSGATYAVPEYRKSGGGYLISCTDAQQAWLSTSGDGPVRMRLFSVNDQRATQWFELPGGQVAALQSLMESYPEKTWTDYGNDLVSAVSNFFNDCRSGRTASANDAAMRLPMSLFSPPTDTLEFARPADVALHWSHTLPAQRAELRDASSGIVLWQSDQAERRSAEPNDWPQIALQAGRWYLFSVVCQSADGQEVSAQQHIYVYSRTELAQLNHFIE